MSSSDYPAENPRRFLIALAATIGVVAAAMLGLTYAKDPFAVVHADRAHENICADSFYRADFDLRLKPLILRYRKPQAVFIGSSKVTRGFDAKGLGQALQLYVANLGVSSADLSLVKALTQQSADAPSVRQIWIGVDFGAFTRQDVPRRELFMPGHRFGDRVDRIIDGVVNPAPIMLALKSMAQVGGCRWSIDPATGANLGSGQLPGGENDIAGFARAQLADFDPHRLSSRMDQFTSILKIARASGKRVVLFITPNSPDVGRLYDRAGMRGDFDRWRQKVHAVGERFGVPVVDIRNDSSTEFPAAKFYDLTHFKPEVGVDIVRAGLAKLPQ